MSGDQLRHPVPEANEASDNQIQAIINAIDQFGTDAYKIIVPMAPDRRRYSFDPGFPRQKGETAADWHLQRKRKEASVLLDVLSAPGLSVGRPDTLPIWQTVIIDTPSASVGTFKSRNELVDLPLNPQTTIVGGDWSRAEVDIAFSATRLAWVAWRMKAPSIYCEIAQEWRTEKRRYQIELQAHLAVQERVRDLDPSIRALEDRKLARLLKKIAEWEWLLEFSAPAAKHSMHPACLSETRRDLMFVTVGELQGPIDFFTSELQLAVDESSRGLDQLICSQLVPLFEGTYGGTAWCQDDEEGRPFGPFAMRFLEEVDYHGERFGDRPTIKTIRTYANKRRQNIT